MGGRYRVSADVVARIAAQVEARRPGLGGMRLVCVDGPAGSGKTTLAGQLAASLPAQVVHMDDLYEGWTGVRAGVDRLHEWVLAPLAAGVAGRYRRYDWELGRYAERHAVPVADSLVVEGCGSACQGVDQYEPLIVWVEADDDLRLQRGLERDGEGEREHWLGFMAAEQEMYARERTRERAHVRLDAWGRLA